MSSCFAFAIRSLEPEQVFVPFVDESQATKIYHVDNVGMQTRMAQVTLKPNVIVIMSGHSMPTVPVKAEQVNAVLDTHSGVLVTGVCFMHMFEKAGWLPVVSFDCLIDAMIDPVEVTMKS
ncbi:MAG: DUF2124 family protein [Methanoregula sp.]|nr:DUF2124 family protein [Methanoregula sp.]